MSTIIEVMLAIRERNPVYYHKDMKQFDRFPYSEMEKPDPNAKLVLGGDKNTIMLPTYEEIDHKDILRFFVRECVEDKGIRRQLFDILRREDYIEEQTVNIADYIIESNATVRQTAKAFGVSKSTVHIVVIKQNGLYGSILFL